MLWCEVAIGVVVIVVVQMVLLYVSVFQMVIDFADVSGIWECLWCAADLSV